MSTLSEDINFSGVLSETKRIIKANISHFSILSLLFLLPLWILFFILPTIFLIVFDTTSTSTITTNSLFHIILYIITIYVLSISGMCTITYSTFHGYYNRPVELITTLRSIFTSLIPVCSTLIIIQLIAFSIGLVAGILGFLVYYWSESFIWFNIFIVVMVLVCSRFLRSNWDIYNVIVVVESKWWYEPLRRSSYLMQGMEKIKMKMNLAFGLISCLLVFSCSWNSWTGVSDETWLLVVKMVVGSCGMTVLMLYRLAANVVMYIYSKKMHGELDMEIQPEKYISLPIDDEDDDDDDDPKKSVVVVVHA